jgi:GNAT superfamily N-acetyltransferase
MDMQVNRTRLEDIQKFRALFLQECNTLVRYNACHERGWSDSYLLRLGNQPIGYGSLKGKDKLTDRDAIFEFYVIPPYRSLAGIFFTKLLQATSTKYIECQSNDPFLCSLLYEFSQDIYSDVILFKDHISSEHVRSGISFRGRLETDTIFEHKLEPPGDYILELDGAVIGTGGFMLYYNLPFADVYMEVEEKFQRRGFGSYLVQELKRECYLHGRLPAARCNADNTASRATLLKAGFAVSGQMLTGRVKLELRNEKR